MYIDIIYNVTSVDLVCLIKEKKTDKEKKKRDNDKYLKNRKSSFFFYLTHILRFM
jgi:hypothetical protein